ncbi:MAG TPA: tetratricopeptide repeat protein [Candidatus Hydrogenedentes bacterium]|nr:tetratricopeptide repeat protein [Candidatus Hydrogenedentota bacterium]HRT63250.1 tetratricopeptide repeat protein [Candidatus Hydrogenedentota bacterium]
MRKGLEPVLLFLVAVLVYLPALRNDFVNYDDHLYVTNNLQTQAGLTWQGTAWAFRTLHGSNWMPLTWLSHMLDAQLFGMNPAGHHATNIVFHAANTLLLYLALRRMTGAPDRAFVVAALFAIHPLHVESVAWVAERKDVLCGFFFMTALWTYAAYAARPSLIRYAAVTVLFALGLMSKSMIVTLPCVLLLLDYWPLDRLRGQWIECVIEKLPWFLLSAMASFMAFFAQARGGSVSDFTDYSLPVRIANAATAYAGYLWKTIRPFDLAVFYPHPGNTIPFPVVFGAALFLFTVTMAVLLVARRIPYAITGWFWYLGMLVPVIGLVQIGRQAMADRYTYLPLIGLFIMATWGVGEVWRARRLPPAILRIAVFVLLAALSVRTVEQIGVWEDSETLFRHALAVTRNNEEALYSLGCAYLDAERYEDAARQFEAALRIEPNHVECITNLGIVMDKLGHSSTAIDLFHRSLRIRPDHHNTLMNLGVCLLNAGKKAEAAPYLEKAVTLRPDDPDARNNYGMLLLQLGHVEEGISHVRYFLALNPDRLDIRRLLGKACMRSGHFQEAVEQFAAIAAALPNNADAAANLGLALASANRFQEAAEALRSACALSPDDMDLRFNYANALLRAGQRNEAIQALVELVNRRPNDADAHYLLGMALEESGKHEEAANHFIETLRHEPGHDGALAYLKKIKEAMP